MTDQVTGRHRRAKGYAMFAAITDAKVTNFESTMTPKKTLTATFDRELTEVETLAVLACLESADDADMATRAALRELAEAVEAMPTTPMRALLLSLTTRVLDA